MDPQAEGHPHDIALLAALPAPARSQLMETAREETYPAGRAIVVEGDQGDAFLIITEGTADVLKADRVVAHLGPGDAFGEMAVLTSSPRSATVKASTEVHVRRIEGEALRQAVDSNRGFAVALEGEMALRTAASTLGASSPFAGLEPDALRWLAAKLERVEVPPDADVIHEGDLGDAMYIIEEGTAQVVAAAPTGAHTVADLKAGDVFGEQALLSGEPRTATVRAVGRLVLLRLAKQDFEDSLERFRGRRDYFVQLAIRRQRPSRLDGTQIVRSGTASRPYYVLTDRKGRYLKLSEQAAYLWDLMDGDRTVRDLVVALYERYHLIAVDTVLDAMLQLHAAGFVKIQSMDRGEESATSVKSTGAGFGVLTHYFSLPRVDSLVTSAYRSWFRFLFQRPVLAALALVGLSGSLFFLIRLFTGTLPHPDPSNLAAVSLGTVVAIGVQVVLHETAHAVTCKHFGREVRRAGIGWYFLMPVAFVDTSDIWLSGRLARMSVALAGPVTNLVLAAGATLLLPIASPTAAAVLASFAVVGFSIALLNMNPLIEFDGYYVLMDLVDVPNLRSRAIGYIGSLATRRRPELGRREARILLVYGLLALAYTAFVALAILNGYRQYVDAAVGGRLPYFLTAPLGWALSLAVVWLILRRTWADLRHKRRAF